MALTAAAKTRSRGRDKQAFIVVSGQTIYAGALVGVDTADGFLKNWADVATLQFKGVAESQDTVGDGTEEARVDIGGKILERVSVTGATGQGDVGELVYASDENTFDLSATANTKAVGVAVRYHTGTKMDVMLFTPGEYRGI